jgi:hypothetical protein
LKEIGGVFVYTHVGTSIMAEPPKTSELDLAPTEREDLIPTRESLLSRLKDWKDSESWQDFFDTYWKVIYGIARKAGLSDAEAQDIVRRRSSRWPEKSKASNITRLSARSKAGC